MNRWVVNRGWGRTAVNFHDRSQLMGNNTGSSNDSVSSSDDSVSSGDGSVSDHSVGGVRGNGGNVSNSGNDVGLLSVHGNMDGLVDGGGVRGDHSLGRVDIVGGVVDMGSLNNLLDGVHLVGGGDGDSTGNSDLVRGGHMLVHDDLTLDGNGNMDGDVNVVVLYIELGDDVGLLGSDPGVSPHGGEDPLLDHGVSRSGSLVGGSSRDGSKSRGGSVRDHGRGQGTGLNGVHGRSSDAGYSGLGNVFNSGNSVLVATNNRDLSSLHNLVSDNSVLNTVQRRELQQRRCGGSGLQQQGQKPQGHRGPQRDQQRKHRRWQQQGRGQQRRSQRCRHAQQRGGWMGRRRRSPRRQVRPQICSCCHRSVQKRLPC